MLVMVSGPVSAESDEMRMDNTARLNRVAAAVLKRDTSASRRECSSSSRRRSRRSR
jgi:hypothetical protein